MKYIIVRLEYDGDIWVEGKSVPLDRVAYEYKGKFNNIKSAVKKFKYLHYKGYNVGME